MKHPRTWFCLSVAAVATIVLATIYYRRVWLPKYLVEQLRTATQFAEYARCEKLATQIKAMGADAIPPLVDELLKTDFGVVAPSPCDLLKSFPAEAHRALLKRLQSVSTDNTLDSRWRIRKRDALIHALIDVADDWSCFDIWLSDAVENDRLRDPWNARVTAQMVDEKLKSFSAPPLFVPHSMEGSWDVNPLNPEFVEWWRAHKDDVLEHSSASHNPGRALIP